LYIQLQGKECDTVGYKINEQFLNAFIALDKVCCTKFGVPTGGVTDYVNRLINSRFAPGRDDVLPKLVRYTNLRNRLAHELGALKQLDEVTKNDVKWLREFEKTVLKKKDPISVYLRKARRYARRRKLRRIGIIALTAIAVIAAITVWILVS
jgi:hypothetical protein